MKMPWGKFKGQEIHSLPSSYLKWVAENVKENSELNRYVVVEADEEWQWREKNDQHKED